MTVFDLEGNGFNPDKIWVVSYWDENKGHVISLTEYDDMRKFFLSQSVLIGHNIIRFDIPVIEKVLGIKVKARLIDTLALSWYLYPERNRHGLEWWGRDLGVDKPPIDDWENLSLEEYIYRCEEDVKINHKLWLKQDKYLDKLYDYTSNKTSLVNYLSFKMHCAQLQQEHKWKLDVEKTQKLLGELEAEKERKYTGLCEVMPAVPIIRRRTRPSKPYKKDGTMSEAGKRWFQLLDDFHYPREYMGEVEDVVGWSDPNPDSHPQRKDWLYSLGWKPQTFDYKRDKKTNKLRKIPQIKSSACDGSVCESVIALSEENPEVLLLDSLGILSHRISILKGFLEAEEDGYVTAEIQGLTNTLRFKHSVLVNIPGFDVKYGPEIRSCLSSPEGYTLCGSDQSSLEDRTKQHYMYEYDPEYVEEMNTPGFDPHLDLALLANALTPEQVQAHKDGTENHKKVRHAYKTTNYTATYGALPPTIARAAGVSIAEGERLHRIYWERNWSIQKVVDGLMVKKVEGQMWLYNPVSGFWYTLRHMKDRFSTLNQGTGVYCFDQWVRIVLSMGYKVIAQFHDEIVILIRKGEEQETEEKLNLSVKLLNEKLQLNRSLDIGILFGDNYADIH